MATSTKLVFVFQAMRPASSHRGRSPNTERSESPRSPSDEATCRPARKAASITTVATPRATNPIAAPA